MEHLDKLAREPHTAVMSCELDLGVTDVVDKSWEMLNLIRVYTKRFVSSRNSIFTIQSSILIIL
jgi:ribosome-interacting GTPase 1